MMKNKKQKGFTLIELMVVIVIIGILSALAVPRMFGLSAKAKVAEAPPVIANYETLQEAYFQETGQVSVASAIGYAAPGSRWWQFSPGTTAPTLGAAYTMSTALQAMGNCAATNTLTTQPDVTAGILDWTHAGSAGCTEYLPNY